MGDIISNMVSTANTKYLTLYIYIMVFAINCNKVNSNANHLKSINDNSTLNINIIFPDIAKDQYGNLVVMRDGMKADPITNNKYEIWLDDPRLEFIYIPPGKYMPGSPVGELNRSVVSEDQSGYFNIEFPFYISKYEITQKQWIKIMRYNPSNFIGDNLPVENVTWLECVEFCNITGFGLPTEIEWEYCCRSGSTEAYCYGDTVNNLSEYCWFYDNSNGITHNVGQKKSNAFGIYDMHGNVFEWCDSGWNDTYKEYSDIDVSKMNTFRRVIRGGSYFTMSEKCRSAYRIWMKKSRKDDNVGFRVILRLK